MNARVFNSSWHSTNTVRTMVTLHKSNFHQKLFFFFVFYDSAIFLCFEQIMMEISSRVVHTCATASTRVFIASSWSIEMSYGLCEQRSVQWQWWKQLKKNSAMTTSEAWMCNYKDNTRSRCCWESGVGIFYAN